jgi:hypothetical protein
MLDKGVYVIGFFYPVVRTALRGCGLRYQLRIRGRTLSTQSTPSPKRTRKWRLADRFGGQALRSPESGLGTRRGARPTSQTICTVSSDKIDCCK